MGFFILTAGKHSLSMMTINITSTTLSQVFHEIQGLKLTVSVILHGVATICIFSVILINNVDRFSSVLPSSVILSACAAAFTFAVIAFFIRMPPKRTVLVEVSGASAYKAIQQPPPAVQLSAEPTPPPPPPPKPTPAPPPEPPAVESQRLD
ncbi:hypothetical protein ANCDUO_13999 [Ancylostoma duodenale]|uniref:Uncharacterized protein n=1 Tax=Ancylostoma duodenale TaxID=51022 RepID=A0A0C2GA82_9BILA|nr:hypothetical protein ANCDUO_13999 [Ancylostoma duodenale]